MLYSELPPAPALGSRIECVWSLRDDGSSAAPRSVHRVFPDGCIELIVHLGPPWSWRPEGGDLRVQPECFVAGQLTQPLWLAPAAGGNTMGMRFRPGGAHGILGDDLGRHCDTVTPLEAIWGAEAAKAFARALRTAGADAARLEVANSTLTSRAASGVSTHSAILAAVATILEKRGSLAIAPLARAAGWSERQFGRRFLREVGCLPRQFARTVRFQHLLSLLGDDPTTDWAGLAWDSGFADQAHLIREFRRFTGATPARYRDEALALARRFVSPERLERYFAPRAPSD